MNRTTIPNPSTSSSPIPRPPCGACGATSDAGILSAHEDLFVECACGITLTDAEPEDVATVVAAVSVIRGALAEHACIRSCPARQDLIPLLEAFQGDLYLHQHGLTLTPGPHRQD